MKVIFILIFLLLSSSSFSQKIPRLRLKRGPWIAELKLNDNDVLPFNMFVKKNGKSFDFSVINGDEIIPLDSSVVINDSVHLAFPFFNSELVFHLDTKKSISGYWKNFNKGDNYKIHFTSQRKKNNSLFPRKKENGRN